MGKDIELHKIYSNWENHQHINYAIGLFMAKMIQSPSKAIIYLNALSGKSRGKGYTRYKYDERDVYTIRSMEIKDWITRIEIWESRHTVPIPLINWKKI
jgi:hypothetical protein